MPEKRKRGRPRTKPLEGEVFLYLRLPAELKDAADAAAKKIERPLSYWVREAMREKLEASIAEAEGGQ